MNALRDKVEADCHRNLEKGVVVHPVETRLLNSIWFSPPTSLPGIELHAVSYFGWESRIEAPPIINR